jgi:hypothetical protein
MTTLQRRMLERVFDRGISVREILELKKPIHLVVAKTADRLIVRAKELQRGRT